MRTVLATIIVLLGIVESVLCVSDDDLKKLDTERRHFSSMYYSLDLSLSLSRHFCIWDKKEIDGDVYKDITIKPGIIVTEISNGELEIWKAKPDRDLMKLIVIQKKDNVTYIIITKDRADRVAETQIVVTNVTLTFSPYKDMAVSPLMYTNDPFEHKRKNLRSSESQTDVTYGKELQDLKQKESQLQTSEQITELLPHFLSGTRLGEILEEPVEEMDTSSSPTEPQAKLSY